MFWEQLARALQEAGAARPAPVLLLGSGDEAASATGGLVAERPRRQGELIVPVDANAAFERAIREQNKSAVFRLTDAGVSAVGFVGADRGLLAVRDGEVHAGAWHQVARLAADGVVCLVSCVAAGPAWTDVHPVRVARAVRAKMEWESPYTVMAQRNVDSIPDAGSLVSKDQLARLVHEGCVVQELIHLVNEPVHVAHASRWSLVSKS